MPRWPGELDNFSYNSFLRRTKLSSLRQSLLGRFRESPAPIHHRRIWRIRGGYIPGIGTARDYLWGFGFKQVEGLGDYFYVPHGWVTNGSDYFDPDGELQFSVVQSKRFGLSILPRVRKEIL